MRYVIGVVVVGVVVGALIVGGGGNGNENENGNEDTVEGMGVHTGADTDADTDMDMDTDAGADTDTGADTGADADTDTGADMDTVTHADTGEGAPTEPRSVTIRLPLGFATFGAVDDELVEEWNRLHEAGDLPRRLSADEVQELNAYPLGFGRVVVGAVLEAARAGETVPPWIANEFPDAELVQTFIDDGMPSEHPFHHWFRAAAAAKEE